VVVATLTVNGTEIEVPDEYQHMYIERPSEEPLSVLACLAAVTEMFYGYLDVSIEEGTAISGADFLRAMYYTLGLDEA
jgi:hypothetical protein